MPKAPAPARATPSPPTALTEDDLPEWRKLGMSEEVLQAVQAMGFQEPSAIQKLAMPEIFKVRGV
jgi:superfamily II DNA/RNA helicase